MIKLLTCALCALLLSGSAAAIDLNGLRSVGPVASFVKTDAAVTLTCADGSQVGITVLAPYLIRVRAAFLGKLPGRDHSWAIEKSSWEIPRWDLTDDPGALRISTGELEVVAHRSPLQIEFRDVKTHQAINSDQQPMRFDPQSGVIAAAKTLGFDEHFYGLGEKAARLDKRRGEFTMWNSDTFGYQEGTDPVYQSIPFYIGWQHGAAYGIFFDNSYRTHFDFGATSQEYAAFSAEGGEMNYYFFQGPSITKILARYADLTGHMPLPPMWALGNQQSRYSYYPDSVAEEVVRKYRADDLPLDVLHLDIHFMNGFRPFTWDPQRFPNPKAFTERLRAQGVKVVTIVDPGIKYQLPAEGARDAASHPELAPQDQSYYVYNQGQAQDFFLKRKDGRTYIARVWPGESVFADYTMEGAARWWGDLHRAYTDNGVAGIWNDMNEPSDFNDQTGKSQMDVVTYDGGTYSPYAANRNVFGLNEARATYQGLQRLLPNQRPYVITRAAYAGIQRYATMWAGDNRSTWGALALSLPMFMTLGLSGEPFVGSDVGGFIGRTDAELLVRWYEVGFLTPFCRNHANMDSPDHEPWRYGKYFEDIIRKYLKLRYRLLPFLYTALEESHRTGVPLFRPLLLNYQEDENTLAIDDEFMIARDLWARSSPEALLLHLDNDFQTLRKLIAEMLKRRDQWLRHVAGSPMVGLFLKACEEGIGDVKLEPLRLSANFRSDEGIVTWVNATFPDVLPVDEDIATGAIPFRRSDPVRDLKLDPAVVLHAYVGRDDGREAADVMELVRAAQGRGAKTVAILVRARTHLPAILRALGRAGLRFRAVEIDGLAGVPLIQDLMALTRALLHPADRIAWLGILRAPWCGLTLEGLHKLAGGRRGAAVWDLMHDESLVQTLDADERDRLLRVRVVLDSAFAHRCVSLRQWLEGTWLALGGPACAAGVSAVADAGTFLDLLERLDRGGAIDVDELEEGVKRLYAHPDAGADESLQVMTVHKAKGLEFDVVILPGLGRKPRNEDSRLMLWQERPQLGADPDLLLAPLPATGAGEDTTYNYLKRIEARKAEFEAGRMLYVPATRARSELHLLGHTGCKNSEGIVTAKPPDAASLLRRMWTAAEPDFAAVAAAMEVPADGDVDVEARVPKTIERLTLGWQRPAPPAAVATAGDATGEVEAFKPVSFRWVGDTLRHSGTVVHQMMRRIAEDGLERWDAARVESMKPAYGAALSALGVPEAAVAGAANRVCEALASALAEERVWFPAAREGVEGEIDIICGVAA